jgi:hypothetical protein
VDIRNYRAERRRVLRVVNALLAPSALQAQDWDGEGFVLISPSGASHRAANLSDLWKVAQRIVGSPVDPLALNSRTGATP